ncbi:hypothetical protein [Roseicella aquatilis]|uniref:hypothetical protein n=1 Tax=Roseicella aquatilis TaxID=2527868 RepID=UPI0014043BD7|nr:hypothetical protein [Roseicella aquatilis]
MLHPLVPVPLGDGTAAAVRLTAARVGLPRPVRSRTPRVPTGCGPEIAALYGA